MYPEEERSIPTEARSCFRAEELIIYYIAKVILGFRLADRVTSLPHQNAFFFCSYAEAGLIAITVVKETTLIKSVTTY